jgi:hypothetical protein
MAATFFGPQLLQATWCKAGIRIRLCGYFPSVFMFVGVSKCKGL